MKDFSRLAAMLSEKSLLSISKLINTVTHAGIPILVYNPMVWERNEVIRAKVRLGDLKTKPASYILKDSSNNEIPFSIIREFDDYSPELNNWKYFKAIEIEFTAAAPSMGYSTYYLCEGIGKKLKSEIRITKNSLENENYKIAVSSNGQPQNYR